MLHFLCAASGRTRLVLGCEVFTVVNVMIMSLLGCHAMEYGG